MFEKLGRKFMRGAKAELTDGDGPDIEKILCTGLKVLGAGIMLIAMFMGAKSGHGQPEGSGTIVINNYIMKDDKE